MLVLLSTWAYARGIMLRDDAANLVAPEYADSILGHAWKHYTALEGRLSVILFWDFFQFLTRIIHPRELSSAPGWALIGVSHFAIVAAPINAALLARYVLGIKISGAVLTALFLLSFWGLAPSIFSATLNPGNGPYVFFTWLFTLASLMYVATSGRQRIFAAYPLLALSLAGSDLLFIPTLLFLSAIEFTNVQAGKATCRVALKRLAGVTVLAAGVAAVIWASPGFAARRAAFNSVGAGPLLNGFHWSNFASYYDRLLTNAYVPLMQGTVIEWAVRDKHLIHILVVIFCIAAAYWDFVKGRERNEKSAGPVFVIALVAGFHLTHIRALVSSYHGTYGNDGPIFVLLLAIVFACGSVTKRVSLQQANWRVINTIITLGFLVFAVWPGVANSVYEVRAARLDSEACKGYAENAVSAMAAMPYAGNELYQLNLSGVPRWNMGSCVVAVLKWRGIENIKIGEAGTPSYIDSPLVRTVEGSVKTPLPPSWAPSFGKAPRLVSTRFGLADYQRDYLIRSDIVVLSVLVELNSNLEASPYIVDRYKYDVMLMAGPGGIGVRKTLISKAESSSGSPPDPLDVAMVSDGREVPFLDRNAPRVLRLKIRGGNRKYVYTSSTLVMLGVK